MGLTQRDVTSSMLISLSGSDQVAPSFWLNRANGINYNVGVQTPQYRIDSLDALLRTPVSRRRAGDQHDGRLARRRGEPAASAVGASPSGASQAYGNPGALPAGTQLLSNLVACAAQLRPVDRQPLQRAPVFDVYANVDRRDLGGVGAKSSRSCARKRQPAARHVARPPRPDRDHAVVVFPAGPGDDSAPSCWCTC